MKPVYSVVHVGTEGRKLVSRMLNGERAYLCTAFDDTPSAYSGDIAERTVKDIEEYGEHMALVQGVESFEPESTVFQGGAGVPRMGASTYTRAVP